MDYRTGSRTWGGAMLVGLFVGGCFSPDDPSESSETDLGSTTMGGETESDPSATDSSPTNPSTSATDTSTPTTSMTDASASETETDSDPTDPTNSSDTEDPTGGDSTDSSGGIDAACADGIPVTPGLCLDVAPITYVTSRNPSDLAAGDVTANGLIDLVVLSRGVAGDEGRIEVLEADGVGGFGIGLSSVGPGNGGRVKLADADGDGDADIFASGAGLRFYRNQGTYLASSTIDEFFDPQLGIQDLVIADFDDDGIVDVIVTESYNQRVHPGVLINGIWTGGTPSSLPAPTEGSAGMAVGAFSFDDGDEDIDVVSFNQYYTDATLITNDGSGSLSQLHTVQMCTGEVGGIQSGEMGDFNGDGNTDFAVVCTGGDVSVVLSDDSGGAEELRTLPLAGAYRVYPADLDGDGDLDLLVSSQTLDRAVMFINDGEAEFELSAIQFHTPGPLYGAAVADFDGDGALDVAVASDDEKEGRVDVYFANP